MRNSSESGSAIVEFVLLALPLFLPLLLFIGQFSELSSAEMGARNLVREIVRSYVSAENEGDARRRSAAVLDFAAQKLGFSKIEIQGMKLSFACSSQPCFSPGGKVRADLHLHLSGSGREISVSAEEFVSPWQ